MGAAAGQRTDFVFNLAFEFAGGAHHENDHADYEDCSYQHDPAFHFVLIDGSIGKSDGPGNAANQRGDQGKVDSSTQVRPAYFGQVNQRDAHN